MLVLCNYLNINCLSTDLNNHSPKINIMFPITDIDTPWGVAQCQQRAFEDRYQAKKIGPFRYFAIFDGHGSPKNVDEDHVVDYLTKNLHTRLAEQLFITNIKDENAVKISIQHTFINLDIELHRNKKQNGSTCTMILIHDECNRIYQVNLGDSRSIIFNGKDTIAYNDKIISITKDHIPMNDEARILGAGGEIVMGRISHELGSIGLSRAFGDFEFKHNSFSKESTYDPINGIISGNPDVKIISVTEPMFIILTSDAPYEECAFTDFMLVNMFSYSDIKNLDARAMDMMLKIIPKTSDDITLILVSV